MPPSPRREVKIGFSVERSIEAMTVELQLVFQKVGFCQLPFKRWSRRPAKTLTFSVSARPRKFLRAYCTEPRGPQKRFSLVLKLEGRPTGGSPGTAILPLGTLPPRLLTSNPTTSAIPFR